ncbi:MAG: phosphoglycerate dehydrogenase [bacterium]
MFKIQKLNSISSKGLELFSCDKYEHASEMAQPDAILVRSAPMHDMKLPDSLKAIARAGVGVNNIPLKKCTERGIVVFNTPGANANAVKELVLMSLFLSSRRVYEGINWVKSLAGKGDEVTKLIEKGKKDFAGPEVRGKTLGVIGLGSIGVMVANDALALGMKVTGRDPYISVDSAWGLSRLVSKSVSLDNLISESDYISLHLPLNDTTQGFMNKEKFSLMKKGVRILNFARGGLINNDDLIEAIEKGIVARYITDFPNEALLRLENVIPIPHLGASTPESEENCAVMAVTQLSDFLENGNIAHSVNFPECSLPRTGNQRLVIANKNVPNMIGQFTHILAKKQINIANMLNKSKEDYAMNIIDIDEHIDEDTTGALKNIKDVIMVRLLE